MNESEAWFSLEHVDLSENRGRIRCCSGRYVSKGGRERYVRAIAKYGERAGEGAEFGCEVS
jgi:hypothetical protein